MTWHITEDDNLAHGYTYNSTYDIYWCLLYNSQCNLYLTFTYLTLLHSERPKLYGILAVLSAIGCPVCLFSMAIFPIEDNSIQQTIQFICTTNTVQYNILKLYQ